MPEQTYLQAIYLPSFHSTRIHYQPCGHIRIIWDRDEPTLCQTIGRNTDHIRELDRYRTCEQCQALSERP